MQIPLLTYNQLLLIVKSESADDAGMSNIVDARDSGISPFVWSQIRAMAMEILKFRGHYAELGVESLNTDKFSQMLFVK